MNGAFHAPPLTVPSVFADRQSRRESPKMASRPFQFLEKNAPKSERERPSTLRDWPPCPPIQRDGGWRSRPGVNPFISALTVARCLADFPGVWPQLRDILSTSRSVGRGTGAFIYALSADENRPALAAPRHTSTALFSCRFKCPCPPRRQRHFHGNADRAYNTLHFASQGRVPKGTLWKPCFVRACSHTSSKTQNKRMQSAVKITVGLTAYFVSSCQFSPSFL